MRFKINFYLPLPFFVILSIALTAASFYFMFTKGFKLGSDFVGGVELTVSFKTKTDIPELEKYFHKQNAGIEIQPVLTKPNFYHLRAPLKDKTGETGTNGGITAELKKMVTDGFGDRGPEFEQSRVVSGVISSENQKGAAKVVIWALLGIGLYIAFRFKTYFSIGAIVAVVHDVIVMLGFVVFFQRELSILTVTAVLTVLGYSVNESIVLFDRIREHLKAKRVESFKELLVRSVNDVFTRTIIMISCTLSVVIALYFNSMGSLQDFALVLMVGIISGTYSCIYVSAACLLLIHRFRPQN